MGYLTAMIGKWHLGEAAHGPEAQGFDIALGGNHWGAPATFFFPYRGVRSNGEYRYLPGLGYGTESEYLTDRLTDETIQAIDFAQQNSQPFFIMLNHYAPHTPIEAKPEVEKHFRALLRADMNHQNPGYAAMIKSLDDGVGKILRHLEQTNLLQKTVIVFTSDNGGFIGNDGKREIAVTSNWPLRSGKSSLYEGGVRVPLILYWPGKKAMAQNSDYPVSLTDLHATLMRAGPPNTRLDQTAATEPNDALDLSPLLDQSHQSPTNRSIYFHYPHYYHAPRTTPCSSVLQYPWKLIYYYETQSSELYHLAQDPQEQEDLASKEPRKVAELVTDLHRWLKSVNAELPQPLAAKP
jgi:arylsulfatase A-like enzyme